MGRPEAELCSTRPLPLSLPGGRGHPPDLALWAKLEGEVRELRLLPELGNASPSASRGPHRPPPAAPGPRLAMDIYREACSYLLTNGFPVYEDEGDDQVFTHDSTPYDVGQLDLGYGDRPSDSSGTFSPIGPITPLEEAPEKQLHRRTMVLYKLLENEEVYISELESLLMPIRPLKAVAYTSQPVLTSQEIQTIFFKVSEVHEIHKDFFSKLKERTEGEEHVQPVGDLFQELVNQFGVYRAFINNYPLAVETAEKCIQSKEQFKQISQKMRLKPTKESKDTPTTTTLEVLLYKPLNHVTRVILSIRQLLDDTPRDHPDFCLLEKALNDSNCFLSMTNQTLPQKSSCRTCDASKDQHLVKDGFVVEVSENSRKLRHLFLSTNLLFSAKQKKISGRHPQYKCDWYVPLEDISLQTQSEIDLMAPGALQTVAQMDIEETKGRLMETKIEIYLEKRHNKGFDRLKKKLSDIESWLLLNSPSIPLGVQSRSGKSYLFLLSSDYELHDWREIIERLKKSGSNPVSMTPYEASNLINGCLEQGALSNPPLHSNAEDAEDKIMRGTLSLRIHSVSGFTQALNVYCCFEADTYGYFEKKAQTTVLTNVKNPKWEEEIEVELDGAQYLRILLWEQHDYRTTSDKGERNRGDRLLGKTQIWLNPNSLQPKEWKQCLIRMNGHEVSYSMRYLQQSLSQLDELSGAPRGVFAVPISIVTYRDRSRVPLIVRHCVENVESRGLDELGIYRVSGIATDVLALKEAFDTNGKQAIARLKEMDIHAVAGTLKLYLRELPEPLFTDELIPSFVKAVGLEDPVAKGKSMTSLLDRLPQPNLNTFLYLLAHLKRVAEHEQVNKMTFHNLATVFGPSLLRTKTEGFSMDISQEVVVQVQVIFHFLSDDKLPHLEPGSRVESFSTEM